MSTRPTIEDLQAAPAGSQITFQRLSGEAITGTLHGTRRETGYFYAEVIYTDSLDNEVRDLVFHADIKTIGATE